MTSPSSTRLARDIRDHIPSRVRTEGYIALDEREDAIWAAALPYLQVRNNDRHSLYAYGIARALLAQIPDADPAIVLPTILLHDIGWSSVPDEYMLEAIAPGGGRADLVRQHEVEGARIAGEILANLQYAPDVIARIVSIIDGHDSRREAMSPEDAIVKDADKIWRLTPDGLDVVCGWFDLTMDEALRLCCSRVHSRLFTEHGRAMSFALAAIASIDVSVQRAAISTAPHGASAELPT